MIKNRGYSLCEGLIEGEPKGGNPLSNRSLGTVDIHASKGFVDRWVHLSFAIFTIFNVKRELKLLEMACDQVQTCLIFPMRWAGFPIKIGRNAQWVHLGVTSKYTGCDPFIQQQAAADLI